MMLRKEDDNRAKTYRVQGYQKSGRWCLWKLEQLSQEPDIKTLSREPAEWKLISESKPPFPKHTSLPVLLSFIMEISDISLVILLRIFVVWLGIDVLSPELGWKLITEESKLLSHNIPSYLSSCFSLSHGVDLVWMELDWMDIFGWGHLRYSIAYLALLITMILHRN